VTGVWGYDACPADVVAAIVGMAASAYKKSKVSGDSYGALGDVGVPITKAAHATMQARRVVAM
jgi:hypothetical protein